MWRAFKLVYWTKSILRTLYVEYHNKIKSNLSHIELGYFKT